APPTMGRQKGSPVAAYADVVACFQCRARARKCSNGCHTGNSCAQMGLASPGISSGGAIAATGSGALPQAWAAVALARAPAPMPGPAITQGAFPEEGVA
ncbi:unnamed protein product, partial [Polarella glacialis]